MENIKPYTKYRPSGITWLDYIPEHWDVKSVRKSFLFSVGFTPPTEKDEYFTFSDNGIPWITIRDMKGKYISKSKQDISQFYIDTFNKPLILKGSLLYSFKLSVGKVGFANIDLFTNEAIFSVLPNENYCLNYFYYSLPNQIIKNASENIYGAKILNQSLIKSAKIVFPPIEEQKTIANFLDYKTAKIDRFIRKKKQLIKLLNEQKTSIINHAVTKGLDENVKTKPSGIDWLGDIPEHWEVRRTKVLFKLVTNFAPINNDEELLSVYTEIGVKPRKDLVAKGNKSSTTDGYWLVQKGDIIVNKLLAWMGAVGVSEYDGVTSPAYDILRSKGEAFSSFYHYLFRNPKTFKEFKRHSRGIMDMRLRLYFSELGNIYMPLPPIDEQKQIVNYIENETSIINKTILNIEKEIALVQEYRTALIAEAVTGKFDLRDYQLPVIDEELLYEEFEEEELDMVAEDGETMEIE